MSGNVSHLIKRKSRWTDLFVLICNSTTEVWGRVFVTFTHTHINTHYDDYLYMTTWLWCDIDVNFCLRSPEFYYSGHHKYYNHSITVTFWSVMSTSTDTDKASVIVHEMSQNEEFKSFFKSLMKEAVNEEMNKCDSTHQKEPVVSEYQNWLFGLS